MARVPVYIFRGASTQRCLRDKARLLKPKEVVSFYAKNDAARLLGPPQFLAVETTPL